MALFGNNSCLRRWLLTAWRLFFPTPAICPSNRRFKWRASPRLFSVHLPRKHEGGKAQKYDASRVGGWGLSLEHAARQRRRTGCAAVWPRSGYSQSVVPAIDGVGPCCKKKTILAVLYMSRHCSMAHPGSSSGRREKNVVPASSRRSVGSFGHGNFAFQAVSFVSTYRGRHVPALLRKHGSCDVILFGCLFSVMRWAWHVKPARDTLVSVPWTSE